MVNTNSIGALIISMGAHYTIVIIKNHQNSIGSYVSPYSTKHTTPFEAPAFQLVTVTASWYLRCRCIVRYYIPLELYDILPRRKPKYSTDQHAKVRRHRDWQGRMLRRKQWHSFPISPA